MRFMMIYTSPNADHADPPTEEEMEQMGRYIEEVAASGALLMTDGLMPSSSGARVRQEAGNVTVKDGPFTETKELVAGFAIFNLASKDEAIRHAREFLARAGDGQVEIRQMYDEPAFVAPSLAGVSG
ncbi:MAG: YciI family protein [Dehalococcoidia bacterium]|nr:YciI family protein [Dehalococcoidia bacterium]